MLLTFDTPPAIIRPAPEIIRPSIADRLRYDPVMLAASGSALRSAAGKNAATILQTAGVSSYTTTTNTTSYSESGLSLSLLAASNRWVGFIVGTHGGTPPGSFQLNGSSPDVFDINTYGDHWTGYAFSLQETGTTMSWTINTGSGNMSGVAVYVVEFYSDAANPVNDTYTTTGNTGTWTGSIDVVANGTVLAATSYGNASDGTWSGLTERNAIDVNTNEWCSTATAYSLSADASYSFSENGVSASGNRSVYGVSLKAA